MYGKGQFLFKSISTNPKSPLCLLLFLLWSTIFFCLSVSLSFFFYLCFANSKPFQILAPRIGYLPLLAPLIKPYFSSTLPPGVDTIWFDYNGLPLKWFFFLKVHLLLNFSCYCLIIQKCLKPEIQKLFLLQVHTNWSSFRSSVPWAWKALEHHCKFRLTIVITIIIKISDCFSILGCLWTFCPLDQCWIIVSVPAKIHGLLNYPCFLKFVTWFKSTLKLSTLSKRGFWGDWRDGTIFISG